MSERVLFVDDDQLILLGILKVRKRLGYETEVATSSRQALEKIRTQSPYDAVVSDWDMPGMDGLEFLRRCREQAPSMIRIMLSGGSHDEEIDRAIGEDLLFRFIPKPCTPHQISLHLEAALRDRNNRITASC